MKLVYVILIFISLVSAEQETLGTIDTSYNNRNIVDTENSDVIINNLVDRSIPQISQFIINHGLDPLNLPQTEIKLWMDLSKTLRMDLQIEPMNEPMFYKPYLILHPGILKHLSNLKRYGDATLNYNDKILKLDVGFEFTLLQCIQNLRKILLLGYQDPAKPKMGTYNFTVNLVFLNFKGRIITSAPNVRVKAIVTFNTLNYTLSLDKFELQVPGSIKVIIENKKGGLDWINTFIVNIVTPFFKNRITNVIQEEAANAIRTYLDEINDIIAKSKLVTSVFANHESGISTT